MSLGTPLAELVMFLGAFLIGGIPFGWLVAKVFKGVDLRTVGSGSVGATNASRLWTGASSIVMFMLVFALDFDLEDGKEYWLGLHNFYVITRYNHSNLYGLAAFQLSEELRSQRAQSGEGQ